MALSHFRGFAENVGGQGEGMPHRRSNPTTYTNSYALRHNQTVEESCLWIYLRSHRLSGVHFRRQHVIGRYIVDFCAPRLKLVVELDGGQHVDQKEYDIERTTYLESKGFRVLRFWNNEINRNIEEVLALILLTIEGIRGKEETQRNPLPASPKIPKRILGEENKPVAWTV